MKWPAPTRAAHEEFCNLEGWTEVRNARGKKGSHHKTYELVLPSGDILRTRISHPPDRTTYGEQLWSHILRDQLKVDEPDFWACVNDGTRPTRGAAPAPHEALPLELAHLLRSRLGLSEDEIAAISKDEAIARMQSYWESET